MAPSRRHWEIDEWGNTYDDEALGNIADALRIPIERVHREQSALNAAARWFTLEGHRRHDPPPSILKRKLERLATAAAKLAEVRERGAARKPTKAVLDCMEDFHIAAALRKVAPGGEEEHLLLTPSSGRRSIGRPQNLDSGCRLPPGTTTATLSWGLFGSSYTS